MDEKTKISEQWSAFYDMLKKANLSNMIDFATSMNLIDKYNEPLFRYLSLKKIPIVYVKKERLKNSTLYKELGNMPNAVFWCVELKVKDIKKISIFINTEGKPLFELSRLAIHRQENLLDKMEGSLCHESIHAYLFDIDFNKRSDFVGKSLLIRQQILDKRHLTNNKYILNRLNIIEKSDIQEIITYILTEKILSDFVKSIVIEGKNGWIAYCDFINYIDPAGILIKYASKRQEIPDKIMADAGIKYSIFKQKGVIPEIKMKEGGLVSTDAKDGGIVAGKPHEKGGVKAIIKDTGQPVEIEAGEAVIKKTVIKSKRKYNFEGKERTPREILNKLNTDEGGNKI